MCSFQIYTNGNHHFVSFGHDDITCQSCYGKVLISVQMDEIGELPVCVLGNSTLLVIACFQYFQRMTYFLN